LAHRAWAAITATGIQAVRQTVIELAAGSQRATRPYNKAIYSASNRSSSVGSAQGAQGGLRRLCVVQLACRAGAKPALVAARHRSSMVVRAANEPSRSASPVRDSFERSEPLPIGSPVPNAPLISNPAGELFSNIERLVQNTFNSQAPGQRSNDWKEVEGGAWVLFPPEGRPPQVRSLSGCVVS
jgi:hypothetical protein